MKKLIALFLVLFALLQYRLWFGDGGIREFQQTQLRLDELKKEGEKRSERIAALQADVRDLKEGTDAIEERARRELGMVKEGEFFVQVFDKVSPLPFSYPDPDQGKLSQKTKRNRLQKVERVKGNKPTTKTHKKKQE